MLGPKIDVTIANANGAPLVFTGQANTVTLTLKNSSGADILIQPGTPSDPPPEGGGFQIVMSFAELFGGTDGQKDLLISAPGWTAQYFPGSFPSWIAAAAAAVNWQQGTLLNFSVSQLQPLSSLGSYTVSVDLYNLSADPQPNSVVLGIANPPDGKKDLRGVLEPSLAEDRVYITRTPDDKISNNLRLRLTNKTFTPVVPLSTHYETQPQFSLSFIIDPEGPGYYALTDDIFAAGIDVKLHKGTGWSVTKDPDNLVWWLRPDTQTNPGIVGGGETVEFNIDDIVTMFPEGVTLLYLIYNNIPGYDDGFMSVRIDKKYGPPRINLFEANTNVLPNTGLATPEAFLSWDVSNAMLVQLSGAAELGGPVAPRVMNQRVTVARTSMFVLTAFDTVTHQIHSQSVPITLEPASSGRLFPPGTIIAWRGAAPAGWIACDGEHGTPDLRDRFILAAGPGVSPDSEGDPTHTHPLTELKSNTDTSSDGHHRHNFPPDWYGRNYYTDNYLGIDTLHPYDNFRTSGEQPSHHHNLALQYQTQTTGPQEGGTRPRWWALLYIMKSWAA